MIARYIFNLFCLVSGAYLLGCAGIAYAQTQAPSYDEWLKPYAQNYSKEEYQGHPQNWCVVQDGRGLIYVANNDGVLEYDGANWRKIQLSNEAVCRSLASDANGLVYVGGDNELGYLTTDSIGNTIYKSLVPFLPEKQQEFPDIILKTLVLPDGVYFQTYSKVFIWKPESKSFVIREVDPEVGEFHFSFSWNDAFYVRQRNVGLLRLTKSGFERVDGGKFADEPVYFMLPYDQRRAIVGGFESGLTLFDGETFKPLETPVKEYYTKSQPFYGAMVNKKYIAINTLGGGIIILDKSGALVKIINQKNSGVISDNTTWCFQDADRNLWIATGSGISMVDPFEPVSKLEVIDDAKQTVVGIEKLDNALFMATMQKILFTDFNFPKESNPSEQFRKFDDEVELCWDMVKSGSELIVAVQNELYAVTASGKRLLMSGLPVLTMKKSIKDPNRIYVGLEDGLASIYKQNGAWINEGYFGDIEESVRSVVEDDRGYIWAGLSLSNEVIRISKTAKKDTQFVSYQMKTSENFSSDNYLHDLNGDIYLSKESGFWKFDDVKNKFVTSDLLDPLKLAEGFVIHKIAQFSNGIYWISGFSTNSNIDRIYAFRLKDGKVLPVKHGIARAGVFETLTLFADDQNVLWIGSDRGLIRYDHSRYQPGTEVEVRVRKVETNQEQMIYGGALTPDPFGSGQPRSFPERPELRFEQNNLRFSCAAIAYDFPEANQYQYLLVGLNDKWSEWTSETYRDFTNLGEGDYVFKVRARNVHGNISQPAVFAFTILPPWYRTWWAYALYVLMLFGAVYLVIRQQVARVERRNRELEEKVEERTLEVRNKNKQLEEKNEEISSRNEEILAQRDKILIINQDLSQANQEISSQKDEIEHKNQEIMDSILYARRIQESILPSTDDIVESFPDSFVLYKPKDIVSGDFYWFTNVIDDQPIISAVDCTGHGIPGAFMSVMGSSLLNQIVNERRISEPSDILNNLNHLVQINLHQIDPNSESKDGMDMNLVVHDTKNNQLKFAGANNPLYFIRDGELTDMKVNKFPIGGGQYSDRHFDTQVIDLQPGDTAYIFSDGFPDQFGGPRGRKFMYGKFKKLLVKINEMSMSEQRAFLDETIENWMKEGGHDQIDDILVIGLRF